ncbi:hypothetical protein [Bacillus sp. FJAT-45350]|nr:hypothetical protein [Bacillus sp. FJAT-45350]
MPTRTLLIQENSPNNKYNNGKEIDDTRVFKAGIIGDLPVKLFHAGDEDE